MENKNTPAFPRPAFPEMTEQENGGLLLVHHKPTTGLTKREWFAGMALQGMLGNPFLMETIIRGMNRHSQNDYEPAVADGAIQYADAILKELEKEEKNEPYR